MFISPTDIAGLTDPEVQRMVLDLRAGREHQPPSPWVFADRMAAALVRALKERRELLGLLAADLDDDGAEGLGPGDEPISLHQTSRHGR